MVPSASKKIAHATKAHNGLLFLNSTTCIYELAQPLLTH